MHSHEITGALMERAKSRCNTLGNVLWLLFLMSRQIKFFICLCWATCGDISSFPVPRHKIVAANASLLKCHSIVLLMMFFIQ